MLFSACGALYSEGAVPLCSAIGQVDEVANLAKPHRPFEVQLSEPHFPISCILLPHFIPIPLLSYLTKIHFPTGHVTIPFSDHKIVEKARNYCLHVHLTFENYYIKFCFRESLGF